MASNAPQHPGAEGGESAEGVPNKKRKNNRYRAFPEEQKRILKTYEDVESETKKTLDTAFEKLLHVLPSLDNMPDGAWYLKDRLSTLKAKRSLDPIYIGLFGTTGAGKSTLLNAILEKKFFLPVSGSRTCTACIVEIKTSQIKYYEANIHLLSDEEWKKELRNLVELLSKTGEEDEEGSHNDADVDEVIQKLRSIYGQGAETKCYEDLLKMKPVIKIPTLRRIPLKGMTAHELSEKLDPYVRMRSDEDERDPAQDGDEEKMRFWPLIKHVEVTLPRSDVIPEGVVFIDIPGTGDFNSKRDQMWKEGINKCSVIWIISEIVRAQGEKVQEVLLAESIKAYQSGRCTDISLVVTKTDDLNLEEYNWERRHRNIPLQSKHDAILERNAAVKRERGKRMKDKLKRKLPSDSEILDKTDFVYTVSAKGYWDKTLNLKEEESEIPKLRDYVRSVYLKEKKKLLTDYVRETLVILSVVQNLRWTPELLDHFGEQDHLENSVKKEIMALEVQVKKCFDQMNHPLDEGAKDAIKSQKIIKSECLDRDNGNRGYYNTLKALCLRHGMYASRSCPRADINDALAQPIYAKINIMFGNIFRIQRYTRATLRPKLSTFMDAVRQKFVEVGVENSAADNNCRLNFLMQEMEVIMSSLDRYILQKKADIYLSLSLSIQNDLRPYYDEAAKVRGKQACQRMKMILTENIDKEVKSGMFERATERMKEQFQKLKNDMTEKLLNDFSKMIKLAFSHWERVAGDLPDFKREYENINDLLDRLENCE
ncbi:nuclear GTPase SLIP-GC [Alligator sinensis]|uniref:Nuclear GTPase SLIP-GC n=1 Tax=Alligator sinensis TaxID=38654 RepID=A0A1U8DGC3_ALLSI|nr:nuclear GTPase SLIP-GC [Alligator sinensis]XP_006033956.1 nuclear GTPase SLIP-GC [Alligator sinensis]XP_014380307.1 nuclear GTPase SLIP-GC [Alligator sinensis]XP_014380308.1 nuclear GTPase SLIP-GC [Alligator sinensis]